MGAEDQRSLERITRATEPAGAGLRAVDAVAGEYGTRKIGGAPEAEAKGVSGAFHRARAATGNFLARLAEAKRPDRY